MSWPQGWHLDVGANRINVNEFQFRVWAPSVTTVALHLLDHDQLLPMQPDGNGYFQTTVQGIAAHQRYYYVLNGTTDRPDPSSRAQPEGVHGPSMVIDPASFHWTDDSWTGMRLEDLILYELHVGTFSHPGTFDGVVPYLDYLKQQVGVTAIELMPVGQFPGRRNWGYDGTYLYAPQWSYGGPDGFKRLVNACHAAGLAVILDVVYNHLGPEGNYLREYGPYFTDRYKTPWGDAINYDGPDSDAVRDFVIGNALYWVTEYHVDGLRLDAVHGIYDFSASHILKDLVEAVQAQAKYLHRNVVIMGESDLNDARLITSPAAGGYGLDAQWNDDFHHALRVAETGERRGYYMDFDGVRDLATALQSGFVYSGQYSVFRRRKHGNASRLCRPSQFVIFAQNHDQVGNRAVGDRLSVLVPFEKLKAAAAAVLLAPNIPLLFMGEEYAETAPFQYFTDHGDPDLAEAVRTGRRREFAGFEWNHEEVPDPQALSTFERSRLKQTSPDERQRAMLRWVSALIRLRKRVPALKAAGTLAPHHRVWLFDRECVLVLHRWDSAGSAALLIIGFNDAPAQISLAEPVGQWLLELESEAEEFAGTGRPGMPKQLDIRPEGVLLQVGPSSVALFLS